MPSAAYTTFQAMRKDVVDLISAHYVFEHERSESKDTLGYFIRSAMVMLCAAWERYNEDLLIESIDIANAHVSSASALPEEVQKTISGRVKRDKNELSPMWMADNGWKGIWRTFAKGETDALNTPNRENLNALFLSYFGLLEYSRFWTDDGRKKVTKFVGDRGEIAHNGNRARHIEIDELREYQDMIVSCVIEIDSRMADELESRFSASAPIWDRTYLRGDEMPPSIFEHGSSTKLSFGL
jgi:hypothetical protein